MGDPNFDSFTMFDSIFGHEVRDPYEVAREMLAQAAVHHIYCHAGRSDSERTHRKVCVSLSGFRSRNIPKMSALADRTRGEVECVLSSMPVFKPFATKSGIHTGESAGGAEGVADVRGHALHAVRA